MPPHWIKALLLPIPDMITAFEAAHRRQFGFTFEGKAVLVESFEVEAVGGGADIEEQAAALDGTPPEPQDTTRFYSAGAWHEAGVFIREKLKPGVKVAGPRARSSSRTRPSSSSPAGRRRSPRSTMSS